MEEGKQIWNYGSRGKHRNGRVEKGKFETEHWLYGVLYVEWEWYMIFYITHNCDCLLPEWQLSLPYSCSLSECVITLKGARHTGPSLAIVIRTKAIACNHRPSNKHILHLSVYFYLIFYFSFLSLFISTEGCRCESTRVYMSSSSCIGSFIYTPSRLCHSSLPFSFSPPSSALHFPLLYSVLHSFYHSIPPFLPEWRKL